VAAGGLGIDAVARVRAAEVLQQFLDGTLSSDEADAQYPERSPDQAVHEAYLVLFPYLGDFRDFRFTGENQPDAAERAHFSRSILFLKTELPMEWPAFPVNVVRAAQRLLGLASAQEAGDRSVWPFYRQTDYAKAQLQSVE